MSQSENEEYHESEQPNMHTGELNPARLDHYVSPSVTGPLDRRLPWVIEFRVVGTAITLQRHIDETLILGRGDNENSFVPQVDFSQCKGLEHGVSRKHASVYLKEDRLYLKDLFSTNGTRINNVKCEGGKEYRLRHGDDLFLGSLHLQVIYTIVPNRAQVGEVNERKDPRFVTTEVILPKLNIEPFGEQRKVVVLEEDAEVNLVFSITLQKAGFEVQSATEIGRVLNYVTNSMPDVLVLNLMLPDVQALELLRYVRKNQGDRPIHIVVIGNNISGFQMQQAIEAGADIFLGKPVAVEEMLHAIKTLLVN